MSGPLLVGGRRGQPGGNVATWANVGETGRAGRDFRNRFPSRQPIHLISPLTVPSRRCDYHGTAYGRVPWRVIELGTRPNADAGNARALAPSRA
jgi:hypothetical protein